MSPVASSQTAEANCAASAACWLIANASASLRFDAPRGSRARSALKGSVCPLANQDNLSFLFRYAHCDREMNATNLNDLFITSLRSFKINSFAKSTRFAFLVYSRSLVVPPRLKSLSGTATFAALTSAASCRVPLTLDSLRSPTLTL